MKLSVLVFFVRVWTGGKESKMPLVDADFFEKGGKMFVLKFPDTFGPDQQDILF